MILQNIFVLQYDIAEITILQYFAMHIVPMPDEPHNHEIGPRGPDGTRMFSDTHPIHRCLLPGGERHPSRDDTVRTSSRRYAVHRELYGDVRGDLW